MTKNAYIEQIAKKHHISSTQGSDVGVLLLKGQPEDILQFLLDHQKYLLSSILSCERTASSVSEAESSPGYHAVVTRDEAVFTFPVDPKDQYEWCPGGLQYAWNVKTGNFQNGFEFGFSLFTSMGAARCDQGKLEDVLQEGQFSVWKLEGNGSSVVPGVIVEHSLSRGGSSLNIIIKGKDTINLLFSQKPAHVVFQSQADAHTSSEKVPVLYSAE
jgi:hypothetical protein